MWGQIWDYPTSSWSVTSLAKVKKVSDLLSLSDRIMKKMHTMLKRKYHFNAFATWYLRISLYRLALLMGCLLLADHIGPLFLLLLLVIKNLPILGFIAGVVGLVIAKLRIEKKVSMLCVLLNVVALIIGYWLNDIFFASLVCFPW